MDPLGSQGSLTLSDDGLLLFAANAGSGTVSVFRVFGSSSVVGFFLRALMGQARGVYTFFAHASG